MKHLFAFALFALLLLPVSARAEDCHEKCTGLCSQSGTSMDQGLCVHQCTDGCMKLGEGDTPENPTMQGAGAAIAPIPPTATITPIAKSAEPVGTFGAMAVSNRQPSASNIAANMPTVQAAESAAMAACTNAPSKPTDCKVMVRFSNSCSALSGRFNVDGTLRAFGAEMGPTPAIAQFKANNLCVNTGNGNCQLLLSDCSGIQVK